MVMEDKVMKKFKIGDKVRLKKKTINWYLSEECFNMYGYRNGTFDEEGWDQNVVLMLSFLIDKDFYIEITGYGTECFKTKVPQSKEYNYFESHSLIKVK